MDHHQMGLRVFMYMYAFLIIIMIMIIYYLFCHATWSEDHQMLEMSFPYQVALPAATLRLVASVWLYQWGCV